MDLEGPPRGKKVAVNVCFFKPSLYEQSPWQRRCCSIIIWIWDLFLSCQGETELSHDKDPTTASPENTLILWTHLNLVPSCCAWNTVPVIEEFFCPLLQTAFVMRAAVCNPSKDDCLERKERARVMLLLSHFDVSLPDKCVCSLSWYVTQSR